MPASYAHLTLIAKMRDHMQELPNEVRASFLYYPHFCDLGAVSPDYPYLALGNEAANDWADLMHYEQVVELLNAGVSRLRNLQGNERRKCLAWFLGYASHVVLDMTVHPVVELKVGPYKGNETAHRICELHQDAFIFPQLNLGEVGVPEYFDSGIARCTSKQSPRAIHEGVRGLWQGMLQDAYSEAFASNPPDPDLWHRGFLFVMD
ncbi:MAG: zinc dependent phospholipase C family protein [Desulfarculaceae bacterium]|nr:zinc dependent phospholipase C family protein [Desulfarculaceae bacterium]